LSRVQGLIAHVESIYGMHLSFLLIVLLFSSTSERRLGRRLRSKSSFRTDVIPMHSTLSCVVDWSQTHCPANRPLQLNPFFIHILKTTSTKGFSHLLAFLPFVSMPWDHCFTDPDCQLSYHTDSSSDPSLFAFCDI